MKKPSSPIHRPFAHRWRDIRLRYIPLIVYLTGICVVGWLWNTHWMPGTFSGEVQAAAANVASPQDGQLVSLSVSQFDRVRKGQVLGKVSLPPELVDASLAAARADLQIMRERLKQDQRRNDQNYQRLLAERMDQKAALDLVHFDLRYVDTDLVRTQKLRSDEYIERLRTQVRERNELIAEMDRALEVMNRTESADGDSQMAAAIDDAINAQEEQLLQSAETILRSPIDGVVMKVNRREGEYIASGEPLIEISGDQAESILGFVRQPIAFTPKVGDTVVVRSRRGNQRVAAEATVVAVGARLELFSRPLRVRGLGNAQERGLPVLIDVPDELALYPGELVDLAMKN